MTVDPWAPENLASVTAITPAQPPLTDDEVEAIRDEIRANQHDDRGLIPELHQIGFNALAALGVAGDRDATQAVRLMLKRAKFGGPLAEYPRGEIA
jgi:hypothetical protein